MEDSIIVYSSATCPKCKMLKMELNKRGIEFEDCQDVEKMFALGIKTVPVLSVNGQFFGMSEAIKWIKER